MSHLYVLNGNGRYRKVFQLIKRIFFCRQWRSFISKTCSIMIFFSNFHFFLSFLLLFYFLLFVFFSILPAGLIFLISITFFFYLLSVHFIFFFSSTFLNHTFHFQFSPINSLFTPKILSYSSSDFHFFWCDFFFLFFPFLTILLIHYFIIYSQFSSFRPFPSSSSFFLYSSLFHSFFFSSLNAQFSLLSFF